MIRGPKDRPGKKKFLKPTGVGVYIGGGRHRKNIHQPEIYTDHGSETFLVGVDIWLVDGCTVAYACAYTNNKEWGRYTNGLAPNHPNRWLRLQQTQTGARTSAREYEDSPARHPWPQGKNGAPHPRPNRNHPPATQVTDPPLTQVTDLQTKASLKWSRQVKRPPCIKHGMQHAAMSNLPPQYQHVLLYPTYR